MNRRMFVYIVLFLVAFTITLVVRWKLKNRETKVHFSFVNTACVIPIEVNGKSFPFLWDTGSQHSAISGNVADELGINRVGDPLNLIVLEGRTKYNGYFSEPVDLNIGREKRREVLIIDDNFENIHSDEFKGILGMDFISNYHWLFNYDNCNLIISNKRIVESTKESCRFSCLINDMLLYCGITAQDGSKIYIRFDSGYAGIVAQNGKYALRSDIAFLMPDTDSIGQVAQFITEKLTINRARISYFIEGKEFNGFVCNGAILGGYETDLMHCFVDFSPFFREDIGIQSFSDKNNTIYKGIYLTSNFPRRFNKLYYNPSNSTLSFFKTENGESYRYNPRELEYFFNQMRNGEE